MIEGLPLVEQPPAGFALMIRRGGNVIFGGATIAEAWAAVVDFDWEEDGDPELEWGEWGAWISTSDTDPAATTTLELIIAEARKEGLLDGVGGFGGYEAELIKGEFRFAWQSGTCHVKINFDARTQYRTNKHEGVWTDGFTEPKEYVWSGTGIDDDFVANDIDTWPLSGSEVFSIGVGTPELPAPSDPTDPVTAHTYETRVILTNFRFSFVEPYTPTGSQPNGWPEE